MTTCPTCGGPVSRPHYLPTPRFPVFTFMVLVGLLVWTCFRLVTQ